MTTPNGNVLFNATTGSDTQSSGLGPATSVYGSGASITSGSNVVTGIDTTGVSSGDLLWVLSSTGRQFSVIATVDSSQQVTCDDTFAVTETGRTWACGGKRATLDDASSRRLIGDGGATDLPYPAWAEIETDQTITAPVQGRVSRRIMSSSGGKKQITFNLSTGITCMGGGGLFKDLILLSLSPSSYVLGYSSTSYLHGHNTSTYRNCTIKDFKALGVGLSRWHQCELYGCVIEGVSTGAATYGYTADALVGNNTSIYATQSKFKNCGYIPDQRSKAYNCIFEGDGSNKVANKMRLKRCLIYNYTSVIGSTTDLEINSNFQVQYSNPCIEDCVIHTISSDVINLSSSTLTTHRMEARGNYFYNVNQFCNVGGVEDFISVDNTTLQNDPFVNVSAGDFNLNADAGGGAVLRSNNYTVGG